VIYTAGTVDSISVAGRIIGSFRLGAVPANVTQFGGSNGSFSGGRPEVNLTHAGGTAIGSTGTTNFRAFFDGTGYGPFHFRGTVASVTNQTTIVLSTNGPQNDGALVGCTIAFYSPNEGEEDGPARSFRTITGYNYDAAVRTITLDSAPDFTLEGGETVDILPPGYTKADRAAAIVRSSTATGGGATSITLDSAASSMADFYKGTYVFITGGTGAGQYRLCTAYNNSTKVATITPA
jgi:hypothetical protein